MPLVLLLQLSLVVVITHSQQNEGSDVYKEAVLNTEDFASFENGSHLDAIPEYLKSADHRRIALDSDDDAHHVGGNVSDAHRTRRNAYGNIWPGGKVPYVISDAYWWWQVGMIKRAMKEIENKTCIVFTTRTDEKDYIFIGPISGCLSAVGRTGRGKQNVSLTYWCFYHGTIMHELMHALGFRHEHQRGDRDNHVIIYPDNIQKGREYDFAVKAGQTYELPYDLSSIMHYDSWDSCDCTWGWYTTMTMKNGSKIYKAEHLSDNDNKRINMRYGCKTGASA